MSCRGKIALTALALGGAAGGLGCYLVKDWLAALPRWEGIAFFLCASGTFLIVVRVVGKTVPYEYNRAVWPAREFEDTFRNLAPAILRELADRPGGPNVVRRPLQGFETLRGGIIQAILRDTPWASAGELNVRRSGHAAT